MTEWDDTTVWTFVLVMAAAFFYRYMPRWQARSPFVSSDDLKRRLDSGEDVVVLDVRTPSEYAGRGGHIPGAVNVPLADLKSRLMSRDEDLAAFKDHPVFVHCTGELRAARGARALREAKFNNVSVIKGGFHGWRRRRYPTETGA